MIRDPSDGSVRDPIVEKAMRVAIELINYELDRANERMGFPPLPPASGLPLESTKAESKAKLEKSRAWLKNYHGSGE